MKIHSRYRLDFFFSKGNSAGLPDSKGSITAPVPTALDFTHTAFGALLTHRTGRAGLSCQFARTEQQQT